MLGDRFCVFGEPFVWNSVQCWKTSSQNFTRGRAAYCPGFSSYWLFGGGPPVAGRECTSIMECYSKERRFLWQKNMLVEGADADVQSRS
jgi:hypothetical protein